MYTNPHSPFTNFRPVAISKSRKSVTESGTNAQPSSRHEHASRGDAGTVLKLAGQMSIRGQSNWLIVKSGVPL